MSDKFKVDEHGVPWYEIQGEECFEEEKALAVLLNARELFSNGRQYVDLDGEKMPSTVVLFVNCNDIFVWGSADAQELPYDEIGTLYKMWRADKSWGTAKWCCRQRQQKPQKPVEDRMKEAGVWDAEMEGLPPNDKFRTPA